MFLRNNEKKKETNFWIDVVLVTVSWAPSTQVAVERIKTHFSYWAVRMCLPINCERSIKIKKAIIASFSHIVSSTVFSSSTLSPYDYSQTTDAANKWPRPFVEERGDATEGSNFKIGHPIGNGKYIIRYVSLFHSTAKKNNEHEKFGKSLRTMKLH